MRTCLGLLAFPKAFINIDGETDEVVEVCGFVSNQLVLQYLGEALSEDAAQCGVLPSRTGSKSAELNGIGSNSARALFDVE